MVDFGKSDKMIKISGKWIHQTLTTSYFVLYSRKNFFRLRKCFELFYILANQEMDKIVVVLSQKNV